MCNLGTLAVGDTKTATIVARATQAGPVHNDATATSDTGDSNPTNNTGGWTTDVGPAPTVRVHKGVAVLTGPRLRYTIDVENLGPTTAYGVVAKDILDPAWTLISVQTTQGVCDARVVCAIGTLALGATATVTIEIGVFTVEPVYNEVTGTWHGGGVVVTGVTSPALSPRRGEQVAPGRLRRWRDRDVHGCSQQHREWSHDRRHHRHRHAAHGNDLRRQQRRRLYMCRGRTRSDLHADDATGCRRVG